MPVTTPTAWATLLDRSPTTLAQGVRITRKDGVVVCATNGSLSADIPCSVFAAFGITYSDDDGHVYRPDLGMAPTEIQETASVTKPDNYNLQLFVDEVTITSLDIQQGRYDQAEVALFTYDYTDLTKGIFEPRMGYIGTVSIDKGAVLFEVNSTAIKAQVSYGDITSEICRAEFGDDKCKVDLSGNDPVHSLPYTVASCPVSTIVNSRAFTSTSLGSYPDGFFERGYVTITSGPNNGLTFDVESFVSNVLTMRLSPLIPLATSDTVTAVGGCKKTMRACWQDHANGLNARLEPNTPTDEVLSGAPLG